MNASGHHPLSIDSVTDLLAAWRAGDEQAPHALADLVYADLRAMAARSKARMPGARLQTTELVHDTFLRLLQHPLDAIDRVHFFRTVALALRQVLVDTIRHDQADKRGGNVFIVGISAAADVPVYDSSFLRSTSPTGATTSR